MNKNKIECLITLNGAGDFGLFVNGDVNSLARIKGEHKVPEQYHARNMINVLKEVEKYQRIYGVKNVIVKFDLIYFEEGSDE